MISVKFFAGIRESLGSGGISIEAIGLESIADLLDRVCEQNPEWEATLRGERVLVSRNQDMTRLSAAIQDGDEIAFFPPVTGG